MCAYQEPEVYVKRFVGCALSGIESVQFFFEEGGSLTHFLRLIMVLRTSLSSRSLLVGALWIGSK
jgi:hypothetical protein